MAYDGRTAMEEYLNDVSNVIPDKCLDAQIIDECTESMA